MGGLKEDNRIDVYSYRGDPKDDFNFQDHASVDIFCFTDCRSYSKLARLAPLGLKHQFIRRNPLNLQDGGIILFWKDPEFYLAQSFSIICKKSYVFVGFVCRFFHKASNKNIIFSAYYSMQSSENVYYGSGLGELVRCKKSAQKGCCIAADFDLIDPHDEPEELSFSIAGKGVTEFHHLKNPLRVWSSKFVGQSNKRIATELNNVQGEIDNLESEYESQKTQAQQETSDLKTQIEAGLLASKQAFVGIRSELQTFHHSIHGLADLHCRSGENDLETGFSHLAKFIDTIQNCGSLFQDLCDKYTQAQQEYQSTQASITEKKQRLAQIPAPSDLHKSLTKKTKKLLDATPIPKLLRHRRRVIEQWRSDGAVEPCPTCWRYELTSDGFTKCSLHGLIRLPGDNESLSPTNVPTDILFPLLKKHYPQIY